MNEVTGLQQPFPGRSDSTLRSASAKLVFLHLIVVALMASTANADVYRPAFLEFTQTSNETFDMLWKVPTKGRGQDAGIYVVLPTDVVSTRKRRFSIRLRSMCALYGKANV